MWSRPPNPLRMFGVFLAVLASSVLVVGSVLFFTPDEIKAAWLPREVALFFSLNPQEFLAQQSLPPSQRTRVLAAEDEVTQPQSLVIAVPTIFNDVITSLDSTIQRLLTTQDLIVLGTANIGGVATFESDISVAGTATLNDLILSGSLTADNVDLDLGDGDVSAGTITTNTITAGNVVYTVTAGDGMSSSGGQNPTLTNTDRGSSQLIFGKIKVGTSTFSAGSNTDTLEFSSNSPGITITSDTGAKKVIFDVSAGDINASGWEVSSSDVILQDLLSNVGIGTATPTEKLHVVGNALIDGDLTVTGATDLQGGTVIANGINNSLGGIISAGSITGATGITSSGPITFSGLGAGIVKSSLAGVLSSGAVDLSSSEVTGTVSVARGGTGVTSYTIGDLLYATGASTLGKLNIGGDGEVLTVQSGALAWGSVVGGGGLCPTCLVNNPNATQTITPTGTTTTGLSIQQASGGTADIFNVTDPTGATKYLRVDSAGNVMLGAGTLASTGNLTVSPASTDPISISPVAQGAGAYTGTITSLDLTDNRTWSFPDSTGTICLTTGNCNGVGGNFGGSGGIGYIPKFQTTTSVTNSQIFDDGTNVGINDVTPSYRLDVNGTGRFVGALSANSTLGVTGAATLSDTLQVSGAGSFLTTLGVTGATTLSDTLGVTGAATFYSSAAVTNNLTVDTDTLHVNATTNTVGIGKVAGTSKLDVYRDTTGIGINVRNEATSGGNTGISSSLYGTGTGTYVAGNFNALGTGMNNINLMLGNVAAPSTNNYDVYAGSSGWYNYFAGNVGIGTISPTFKLEVVGTMKTTGLFTADGSIVLNSTDTIQLDGGTAAIPGLNFGGSSDADSGLYRLTANSIGLITGGVATQGITIGSSGLVGIGTTSPSVALDVVGSLKVSTLSSSGQIPFANASGVLVQDAGLSFDSTNKRLDVSGANNLIRTSDGSGNSIYLSAAAANTLVGNNAYLRIVNSIATIFSTNGASVGIGAGNTNPSSTLSVYDGTASTGATQLLVQGGAAANDALTNQLFRVNQGGGTTGLFVVQGNGNVGIGTTSPATKLDVSNGNTYGRVQLVTSGNGYGVPTAPNTTSDGDKILFLNTATIKTALGANSTNGLWVQANSVGSTSSAFGVFTSTGTSTPTEKFTVTGGGSVGIGTAAPNKLLEISGSDARLAMTETGAAVNNKSWLFGPSSTTFYIKGVSDNFASGSDAFSIARSGYTSYTYGFSNGNVGIGTLSPSARLHSYIANTAVTATNYTGYLENLATNSTTDAINKYGLYITSTGTYTGSSGTATNNYGLYVNTPSGADNNYAAIFAGGNVGVGTTTPSSTLHVKVPAGLGTATAIAIEHGDNSGAGWGIGTGFGGYYGNRMIFSRNDGVTPLSLDNGTVSLGGTDSLGTPTARINATGVGIGTSPGAQLHTSISSAPSLADGNTNIRLGYAGGYAAGSGGAQITFAQEWDSGAPGSIIRVGAIRGFKSQGAGSFGGGVQLMYQPASSADMSAGLTLEQNGRVGIGNSTPGVALHVGSTSVTDSTNLLRLEDANSTCNFTADSGSPSCGSDLTLKKDIVDLDTSDLLTRVASLRPVSYRWNSDGADAPNQYGFIAQEVAALFPNLVTDGQWGDGTTRKFLNMGGLMPYVIGAVREQQALIGGLQLALDEQGELLAGSVAGASTDTDLETLISRVADVEVEQASTSATLDSFAGMASWTSEMMTFLKEVTMAGRVFFQGTVEFLADVTFRGRVTHHDQDTAGFITFEPGEVEAVVVFTRAYSEKPVITLTSEAGLGIATLKDVSGTGFTVVLSSPAVVSGSVTWQAVLVNDARVTRAASGSESVPTPPPSPSADPSPTPEVPSPSPSPVSTPEVSPSPSPEPEVLESPVPSPSPAP